MTLEAVPAGSPPTEVAALAHPVWLIRHAATSWTGRRWCGRADPPLTAAGRRAARILAGELLAELASIGTPGRGSRVLAVMVSPARRARETAEFVEAAFGVSGIVEPDLLEVDVGDAEGLDWPALEVRHPAVAAAIAHGIQPDWPGGETRAEVAARATRAADRIRAAGLAGPVAVVSHGAILHVIAAELVGDSRGLSALGPAGFLRLSPVVHP